MEQRFNAVQLNVIIGPIIVRQHYVINNENGTRDPQISHCGQRVGMSFIVYEWDISPNIKLLWESCNE